MARFWGESITFHKYGDWQEIVVHMPDGGYRARFRHYECRILERGIGLEYHDFATEIEGWFRSRPEDLCSIMTELRGWRDAKEIEEFLAKHETRMRREFGFDAEWRTQFLITTSWGDSDTPNVTS